MNFWNINYKTQRLFYKKPNSFYKLAQNTPTIDREGIDHSSDTHTHFENALSKNPCTLRPAYRDFHFRFLTFRTHFLNEYIFTPSFYKEQIVSIFAGSDSPLYFTKSTFLKSGRLYFSGFLTVNLFATTIMWLRFS